MKKKYELFLNFFGIKILVKCSKLSIYNYLNNYFKHLSILKNNNYDISLILNNDLDSEQLSKKNKLNIINLKPEHYKLKKNKRLIVYCPMKQIALPYERTKHFELSEETLIIYIKDFIFKTLLVNKGIHTLHGSCISKGNSAFVFAGKSKAGKTTISTYLTKKGYIKIADDHCLLIKENGKIYVIPYSFISKIRADTLKFLSHIKEVKKNIINKISSKETKLKINIRDTNYDYNRKFLLKNIFLVKKSKSGKSNLKKMQKKESILFLINDMSNFSVKNKQVDIFDFSYKLVNLVDIYKLNYAYDLEALSNEIEKFL